MDHPLILEDQSDLRRRVIKFVRSSYNVRRGSNIIFVCGGNRPTDMRTLFRTYCEKSLFDYDIFFPEFAMKNFFSGEIAEPFDITEFEELIGDLSEAIVLFPEAAGSFAEVGYFSAIDNLAKRCILALDSTYQASDSFISQGPAKKIAEKSVYQPALQIDYAEPDFTLIAQRIKRFNPIKHRKSFDLNLFSDLTNFELFCLMHELVIILKIATISDVVFILNGLFSAHISLPRVRKIMSILVGSNYLKEIGPFGHLAPGIKKLALLEIRDGFKKEYELIQLEIMNIVEDYKPEFYRLVESAQDAN